VPIFGASTYGKPIANFPKRKKNKIYKTEVGSDNAKELIYSRLRIQIPVPWVPTPGAVHFPLNDLVCDEDELKQITAEKKKAVMVKGQRVMRWDAGGRRNEGLDCFVYALAALRISQMRFGLDLDALDKAKPVQAEVIDRKQNENPSQPVSGNWLNVDGKSPWL
jgi:phage terminase large subunit GpA-like protein